MRFIIAGLLLLHGLIHFIGVAYEWKLAKVKDLAGGKLFPLSHTASKISGLLWLVAGLCFLGAGVLIILKREAGWWRSALIAVLLSQVLIVMYWPAAKWGTVANAVIAAAAILAFGTWTFNKQVAATADSLLKAWSGKNSEVVTPEMLLGLPLPVQRWLAGCGIVGKEKIYLVRLGQKGWMRMKPDQKKWTEAAAEQYITLNEPAFVWKVKMNMAAALPVVGCDRFVRGKGRMNIKLFALVDEVNDANKKIDQGATQRFLAEICWAPSAALLPYIKWEALDAISAKATMTYKGVSGSVLFHFNDKGDMVYCVANRYMGGSEKATLQKWEVRTVAYGIFEGIRMPVQSEATWKLKDSDFTWYKLELTSLEYNKPQLFEP